jgi:hypothetical protein
MKHLRGTLWRILLKSLNGIYLALSVTLAGKRVVVRAFVNMTQKALNREMQLTLSPKGFCS